MLLIYFGLFTFMSGTRTHTNMWLTGKLSLMASTGAWKGHAKWCFHNGFNTSLSRYWKRETSHKKINQTDVQNTRNSSDIRSNKQRPACTCSWLVCRLGLLGFHVSGGGGLKGRGGGAEGGFWLLPASSPSPIAEVPCSGWADSLCRLDLAGAGGTGGSPLRPLHSPLDSLEGRSRKASSQLPRQFRAATTIFNIQYSYDYFRDKAFSL